MTKTDLKVFREYLKNFIIYLCEKDETYVVSEASEVLRSVNEAIEEVENDRED